MMDNRAGRSRVSTLVAFSLLVLSPGQALPQTARASTNAAGPADPNKSPIGGARGPLRVHPKNPRYFTDGSGQAIYLTGAHTWANLQDQAAVDPPPTFDFDRYLDYLQKYNHNFIRMWMWEQARWAPWADGRDQNPRDWFIEPNPYRRTGPGVARDGKAKFDLSKFDPRYFDRLRERVRKAGARGIYVSVMLFQGWSSAKGWNGGRPWLGHPYHPDNNIQSFNGNLKSDVGPDLADPQVRQRQAAYLRKVVDTVNDCDNVLFEVTNEGGTKDWDWWVVRTVRDYEMQKPKQHPVGLTGHGSESNDDMLASPAAWISPGSDRWRDLKTDPRPAPVTKVSLLDTDHVFGVGGDQKWVWKGFLRGYNVLFMDPYEDPQWTPILAAQRVGAPDAEAARRAMGHARRYAMRMNLAESTPRPELASTGYCLADPGREYLVYLPDGGSVKVDLSAAARSFSVEWMHAITGKIVPGPDCSGGDWRTLKAPFAGDVVVFLRAAAAAPKTIAVARFSFGTPTSITRTPWPGFPSARQPLLPEPALPRSPPRTCLPRRKATASNRVANCGPSIEAARRSSCPAIPTPRRSTVPIGPHRTSPADLSRAEATTPSSWHFPTESIRCG
jgi:hypothetical protein